MNVKNLRNYLMAGLLTTVTTAQAGVIIGGTRVVFNAVAKESSLQLSNPDNTPYLIQSWVEDNRKEGAKPSFILTPPLFRLDPDQKNILRIIRTEEALPENKESLFWLNIKAIPSAPRQENTLQFAVNTRIKLIYRPKSLKDGSPDAVADKLTWQLQGNELKVINPTPYYMNFQSVNLSGKSIERVTYVAPNASTTFPLPFSTSGGKIEWKIINDYGGIGKSHTASL
ncbi:TPA: molecular chaperone [Serratia marcescens]|nr:molecular chaperone [Serratia marcescens]HEJ9049145.1 molecular chaperone [Serratia marcescens]